MTGPVTDQCICTAVAIGFVQSGIAARNAQAESTWHQPDQDSGQQWREQRWRIDLPVAIPENVILIE